jgi:hypothetical protein
MAENRPEEGAAVVISSPTMANEVAKYHTRAVLLVARTDIKYHSITTAEISMAFSARLRTPHHEARVTRHRPENFLVLFDYPPQRDMAVQAGMLRVRGIDFDILPWTEAQHSSEATWWYRVRVAIENLPVHAWNAQVSRTVLGDDCHFDKIENATFRQEATDIFFCWVWMWNPTSCTTPSG